MNRRELTDFLGEIALAGRNGRLASIEDALRQQQQAWTCRGGGTRRRISTNTTKCPTLAATSVHNDVSANRNVPIAHTQRRVSRPNWQIF